MLMQVIRLAAGPAAKQLGPLGSYRHAFFKALPPTNTNSEATAPQVSRIKLEARIRRDKQLNIFIL